MRPKLSPFLIAAILGGTGSVLPLTRGQTVAATDFSDKNRSFYQVTSMACLQDSSGQSQRIFLNADISTGPLDAAKFKLILSSSPDSDAPIIVDDAVFVNGQKFDGNRGGNGNNPYNHLGDSPTVCYEGVPAIDVTDCLRRDGHIHVQGMDLGGGVFGCSALYLRVVPR